MKIVIAYRVEQTDAGWLVWRKLPERDECAMGWSGSTRAQVHRTRDSAEQAVRTQRAADMSAAGRLGLRIVHMLPTRAGARCVAPLEVGRPCGEFAACETEIDGVTCALCPEHAQELAEESE